MDESEFETFKSFTILDKTLLFFIKSNKTSFSTDDLKLHFSHHLKILETWYKQQSNDKINI